MKNHIPESFIEEILSRVDIVDIIGARVSLRRAGANFIARCPFHHEKTPSFTVSHSKQFYHCFGCGANGDALKFLREYDGLHFVEAVELFAEKLGLKMPSDIKSKDQENSAPLYTVLAEVMQIYQTYLKEHPMRNGAVEYLKSRGIHGKTAKKFALGYAPSSWETLISTYASDVNKMQNLERAGLIIRNEKGRCYDRFRERLMFPIWNRRGQVVGFGGRVLDKSEPKYLNSPETAVFNKGQELFGLYQARLGNRSLQQLIVVEGYLDVISLVQAGIPEAVATLGTALTDKHIDILFRHVNLLFFCFDGDKAGRQASERALKLCLPHMKEGRRVRFVFLPEGEDPDSFIRKKGRSLFLETLLHAKSLSDYLFEISSKTLNLSQIEGRAELISKARPWIEKLPKGVFQQMMLERLSQLTNINIEILNDKPSKLKEYKLNNSKKSREIILPPPAAIRAVALLLENRTLLSYIPYQHRFSMLKSPGILLLCAIIEILCNKPSISMEDLVESLPEACLQDFNMEKLKAIAQFVPENGVLQEFKGIIVCLEEQLREQDLELLLKRAEENTLSFSEKLKLRDLLDQKEKDRID